MKFKLVIFSLCLLFSMACKETPKEVVMKPEVLETTSEKKVSKSTFEDLEGNAIELADFEGKKVLLNFWATWCKPCVEEMPALLKAEAVLKDDNYVFLLASDQSIDKIKAFKEKKGFNFKFLKFNGAMADFKINALPATFIYNEEGEQRTRIDGATEWNSPEIIQKLREIK